MAHIFGTPCKKNTGKIDPEPAIFSSVLSLCEQQLRFGEGYNVKSRLVI